MSRGPTKQHEATRKALLLAHARAGSAARTRARQMAELGAWLRWRCPALWTKADELAPVQAWEAARLPWALHLAGLMSAELAREACKPFEELAAVGEAYGNSWGLLTRAGATCSLLGYDDGPRSEDNAGRAGPLAAARAQLTRGRRRRLARLGGCQDGGSSGHLGGDIGSGASRRAAAHAATGPAADAGRAGSRADPAARQRA